jgi:AraC-like DNA-binding protein
MPTSTLTGFTYDTGDLPPGERFDAWREMMAATHDVRRPGEADAPFSARLALWHLGSLLLSNGTFSAQVFTRREANIRRDQLDHYALFVQGSGQRVMHAGQHDAEFVLHTGDILIYDLAQPTDALASEGGSGTLYLPRDLVDEVIPGFSGFHGTVLRDAAARLLAGHILALGRALPDLSAATLPHIAAATREMALACLVEHLEGTVAASAPMEAAMRRAIERHIDARLGDPDLGPAAICEAFEISRTTLYRLFDPHGGVAGYIKQRRLLRIRSIILGAADPRPLAEIAEEFGFRSAAHFSREFRQAFGHPASEARSHRPGDLAGGDDVPPQAGIERVFRSLHP